MPLPTFVIAGAQKCGTSSLSASLRKHPEVLVAKGKELHFFDYDVRFERGVEWYAAQFAPKKRHRAWGESTPRYLYDHVARERMLATLPDTRFVVILRDPVKRAYSHYWHSRRLGFEPVEDFEEALALEPVRLAGGEHGAANRFSYADRGRYLPQLQAVAAAVGRDQLHVMLLDDFITDRVVELKRLFAFLGVDTARAETIEPKWTNRYREKTEADDKPQPVAYPPMSEEVRARLVEHFRADNVALGEWLGRDLSAWNRG